MVLAVYVDAYIKLGMIHKIKSNKGFLRSQLGCKQGQLSMKLHTNNHLTILHYE